MKTTLYDHDQLDQRDFATESSATGREADQLRAEINTHAEAIKALGALINVMPPGEARDQLVARRAMHSAARSKSEIALETVESTSDDALPVACEANEVLRGQGPVHSAAIETLGGMIDRMLPGEARDCLVSQHAQHVLAQTRTRIVLHELGAERVRMRRRTCSPPRRLPSRRVCARARASRRAATVARAAARATADPDGEPPRRPRHAPCPTRGDCGGAP